MDSIIGRTRRPCYAGFVHVLPCIRLARPVEAGAIAALSRDCIEAGLSWRWNAARILRSMHDPATNVAVANEFGAVLGFSIMRFEEETAHLMLLAVAPHLRERGLGRHLVEWQEDCARIAGAQLIHAETRADNAVALAFYAELGWKATSRVRGYYEGRIDAVRMEKRTAA